MSDHKSTRFKGVLYIQPLVNNDVINIIMNIHEMLKYRDNTSSFDIRDEDNQDCLAGDPPEALEIAGAGDPPIHWMEPRKAENQPSSKDVYAAFVFRAS